MVEQSAEVVAGPSLEEVLAWTGHRLDEIAGGNVGKVEGAYVDAESGRPEWLLSRMGRFGHHCLVPARDAVCGVGHVWVPYTRDQIRRAPKIEPKAGLTRASEAELLAFYGIGGEAGRAAEIAEGAAQDITARPAA
ncbi:MAG: hypothetical protein ACR2G3_00335 [Solirubrobacterales bacterium]